MKNSTSLYVAVKGFTSQLFLVLFAFFTSLSGVWGQSTANYAFTTNTTGSLALDANGNSVDMTIGTTQLLAAGNDDAISSIANIGFSFIFMGNYYTTFSVTSNGSLGLGAVLSSSTGTNLGTSTQPIITAFGGDEATVTSVGANSKVHYKLQGSAPNRVLVVEWSNIKINFSGYATATAGDGTFQVLLYETTGVVELKYGAMSVATVFTTGPVIGFSAGSTASTIASITSSSNSITTNGTAWVNNTYAVGAITNLNSSANGSRRVYKFTPPTPAAGPSNLTFSSVTATGMTLNWTAASPTTGIVKYVIYNSTNGGTTYNYVSTVALGTNTYAATGLALGTSYTWKVVAISEGVESTSAATGTQATTAGAIYYWVGATGGTWNTPANWNTAANNTGTTRTVVATTDVLIIDGAGTTAGGAMSISVDLASFSIGQLKVTSNTALTLASSATTTRTITITGGGGDDFIIENGSSLILNNATNAVAIAFSGTANTGDISGTLTFAGSTSNLLTTTGGSGTLVTVTSTGIVNIGVTAIAIVGSASTLVFSNGSNCNITGTTTGAYPIPLATWGANSTLTLSGSSTSTTTATNNVQTFGNFIVNLPSLTGTLSFWTTSTTAIIQGNLTITSTGTGIFRALTSGSLTINGNVNINGGKIQPASGAGTFIVLGSTIIGASGTLDQSAGSNNSSYSQRGSTFTNNGTIIGNSTTGTPLNFYSPTNTAMVLDGTGTISSALTSIGVQTTGGLTINHTNQIPTLRVNLFNGLITNSNKLTIGTGTLACIVQTGYAGNTMLGGSFDQSPTFNLGTGTYSLIYAQESTNRTTGFEIPSNRLLSNITNSNSNGVTIAGGALSSAALTLSSGCGNITTTINNILTITGTATSAITRTSTTAFVNGPLELTLPASLGTGSTFLFPIGKTTIYPFELVNPTTNAGGAIVVRAEVFDGSCGGTAGNVMANISSSRYWSVSVTTGSANLTNTNIRLTDALTTGFDAIANSATVTGAYNLVGGTTSTVTSTTILTTTPMSTLSGFYVMGAKAPAVLSTPSISPTGNQCSNVSRAISVLITPGGSPVTSVNLNYSINGSAQTAIVMSNSTSNGGLNPDTWTATIPSVTPVNASVTWAITAIDANSLSSTISGTGYQDAPNTGISSSATATQSTVCSGGITSLGFNVNSGYVNINESFEGASFPPTGWLTLNAGSGNNWVTSSVAKTGSKAMQYTFNGSNAADAWIFTPSQQLVGGQTYTISFWYNTGGGYTEKLKVTAGTSQTKAAQTNIIWTNSSLTNTTYSQATATFVAPSTGTFYFAFNCFSAANQYYLYVDDVLISGGTSANITAYSWSDGSTTIGTSNPQNATVTNSGTTFTCTATVNSCPLTASVTPTVNPLPTAPSATNSTQCGAGMPTASVSDNNSYSTPTFKWYSALTGGTLLQTSTSTTYTTSISTTTTFYVAVVNPSTSCESTRTAVTVTVNQPDAISASTSAAAICLGQSITLTAANTASTPTQNYTYSWVCTTSGSGATSANTNNPASITPIAAGAFTYTVTGTDGACAVTNTVSVTVNTLPNITSATATPSTVCSGSLITLTGASVPASAGIAILGSGTLTGTGTAGTFLRQGNTVGYQFKTQYLFTAAELQAAGLVAGNITGLTFDVSAAGGGTASNLTFRLGVTSLTNLTSTYVTGLTQVYTVATYPSSGTVQTGLQSITFNTPFNWDGISNLVLEACSQLATLGTDGTLRSSTTNFVSTIGNNPSVSGCSSTTGGTTYSERPNFRFNGQIGTNQTSSFSWSWNSTPAVTLATGTTTETNTGASATTKTYTVTATNATTGCSATATTSAVTINPATVAPTATNSAHCGSQTPTCSVTGTGTSGNAFAWYTVATGGTALSGQTASTLSNYPVAGTTTFYVSENNGTCQSARTPVTVNVSTPPSITASASLSTVCSGSPTTLSVSSSNPGYTYSWSNSLGTGASVTASPTSNTTYTVTATDNSGGANNGCAITATVAVATNPLPSAISLTPSSTQNTCLGSVQNISTSGGNLTTIGEVTLGTGTSTLGTSNSYAAFNGYRSSSWIQTIYTASELTAAGLGAGNINSIAYNINSQGSSTTNNITIKIGTTSSTSFSNNTLVSTSSFSTVYGPTSFAHTASGWQNITFATPYNWDGVSNIIVDVWQDGPNSSSDPATFYTVMPDNKSLYTYNVTPSGSATTGTLTVNRFNVRFNGIIPTPQTITFSPSTDLYTNLAATIAYTGNPTTVYSKPTANRTYTATATTAAGCTTSSTVTINVGAPTQQSVASTDYIWKGTTSTAWGTLANWTQFDGTVYSTPSVVPSSTSVVVIPANNTCVQNQPAIGSSSISVQDFKIESGATTTLNSGAQLTISGTLTNNGTLTLESGATLVQGASSTLAGTGTYNVKQAITGANNGSAPNGRFWYLGSPVTLASSSAYFTSNAANVVKKRDEVNNAWTALSSGSPENLVVGQGYYTQAMGNSTINFTGGLLNNGAITISGLTRTAGQGYEGFNLVSNPYPSYLDWDAVTKTDVGNTMWYRTASGSTAGSMVFDTYVAGTGGIGTNLNGAGVSNLIPPMQSFWVRVNSGSTTGSLGLSNSMRAHFTSINGSTAGLKSTNNDRKLFLRMNLLQANKKDQIIVYVNDIATNGFDQYDGEKMMQAGLPQFYTSAAGKKITINGLNSAKKQQKLPITIELPTTGVHSFVIEDLEIDNGLVWLEDKQEEIMQALEPGTVYEFFANSGVNAERFVLHFQLLDTPTPTNTYNEVGSYANFNGKGASVHAEAAGVVVIKLPASTEGNTDIQIRDAAGKLVYTGSTNTLETSVQLEQANGIYYVTLNSASGVEVRKVFIQQ